VKLCWVLGLVALCACADDEDAVRGDHDVEGVVQDEFTQRGIVGAKVTFVSDTLDKAETTSEQDGRFKLEVELPAGVRFGTIEATHSGYADSPRATVFFDGAAIRTELKMRPKN
jgi:hypothetical protein